MCYNNFDYCIKQKFHEYNYSFSYNVPLFTAIAKNKFDIAKLLIDELADINYKPIKYFEDDKKKIPLIISYLYLEKCLNRENLIFVLNNNYDILDNGNDEIIKYWINEFNYFFLELYLKENIKNNKNFEIKNNYYQIAVKKLSINAIIILYEYDKRSKKEILCRVLHYINSYNKRQILMMI